MEPRLDRPRAKPEVFSSSRPHSNMRFNAFYYNSVPLGRILSQCRVLGFKTIVREQIPSSGVSSLEDKGIKKQLQSFQSTELHRISFFTKDLTLSQIQTMDSSKSFIGYVILKRIKTKEADHNWYIYESVIQSSRFENNFMHSKRNFRIRVHDSFFNIEGTLYCQQNSVTTSCAHVSLRSVLMSLFPKREISYKQIDDCLKDDHPHIIRHGESEGLNSEQLRLVLTKFGLGVSEGFQKSEKNKNKKMNLRRLPFQNYLYGSVESGYPALLSYWYEDGSSRPPGHTIPIFGHTFNEDTWVPNADMSYFHIAEDRKYVPSETWVSAFLGHDDNFGSNFCIPRRYPLEDEAVGVHVIGILPKSCKCGSIEAQAICIDYLHHVASHIVSSEGHQGFWSNKIRSRLMNPKTNWIVLRPILLRGERYIEHLERLVGWEGERISRDVIKALKHTTKGIYWMVEISYPELFPANKTKLGEILIRADIAPTTLPDYSSFHILRLPERIYGFARDGKLFDYPSGISDHVPIFSFSNDFKT